MGTGHAEFTRIELLFDALALENALTNTPQILGGSVQAQQNFRLCSSRKQVAILCPKGIHWHLEKVNLFKIDAI